ncbi:hypothetical protein [Clostridium formicaceticum]|uniref:RimK-like ATP-grasp domain protein n=1 Tax=Clostridium formicaceticum TaxID=1497 RepID=A0AAC9RLH0_9CLOT|nr:hypothetical protein [Clostridium formicaceticum]AOY74993.1 hypothetical protein BJL90_02860 [Clostridium formicaceticum]ARE89406.1 RimK-like ATP-grasp domain protein [Clostridium formicaceticum]
MTVYPKVLFVTNKDDLAIDYLIYKFMDRKIPYLRLNSEDITQIGMTYGFGKSVNLKYQDYEYSFEKLQSAYFRRAPSIFPNTHDLNDMKFINGERKDFFEGLYLSLNCKWVNPIFATYKAERKIYQLSLAKELGFKTPNSIVSNSSKQLLNFIENNGTCIIKPICHGLQVTPQGSYSIYTSEIKDINWLKQDIIFESPVFVQNKIKNYRDIRATVVGKEIFAVEIETNDSEKTDWRKPNIIKEYKLHKLPEPLTNLMFRLHEELNLVYSAFDFVLTPSGEYYFLETNPAGEWVWLERELNLPISDAIIYELLN